MLKGQRMEQPLGDAEDDLETYVRWHKWIAIFGLTACYFVIVGIVRRPGPP